MQTDKFSKIIHLSINRTELILFKSFTLKKWLRLLWIAFLAGSLTCGFSGINFPDNYREKDSKSTTKISEGKDNKVKPRSSTKVKKDWEAQLKSYFANPGPLAPTVISIFAIIGLIFLAIIFIFMWLGARFQFVWYEAIAHDSDAINEPFKKYENEGEKLFQFYLSIFALTLVTLASIGYLVYALIVNGYFSSLPTAAVGWMVLFALIFFLAMIVFAIFISIFSYIICPQMVNVMALTRCSVAQAWEKVWEIYHKNVKECWIFVLINFGISIITGIACLIAMFLIIIVFIIFCVLAGLLCGLLFSKMPHVMMGIIIIFGIPMFIAMMAILMSVCLPVAVFFRSMSMYFLSSLNCGYEPLPINKEAESGGI